MPSGTPAGRAERTTLNSCSSEGGALLSLMREETWSDETGKGAGSGTDGQCQGLHMRRTALLCMAVCAVALRTRFPLLLHVTLPPQACEPERVAVSLLHGQGWSNAFAEDTGPTAHVAPLYPVILAGLYQLCGTCETPSGRLSQQFFTLAVALTGLLLLPAVARKLQLPVATGWAAAFLCAWLPHHQWTEVTGQHEQGLAVLVLLGLVWVFADLHQKRWQCRRATGTAALVLAVATLLSPNLLLAAALFYLSELVRRRGERRAVLRCGAILAAACLAVATPWTARNYLVLGGPVPLRSNFGLELAVGNRPGADGRTYSNDFAKVHPFCSASEREHLRRVGELAYMREKRDQALAWIADHPAEFAFLTLRRVELFWFTTDQRWYSSEPRVRLPIRIYGVLGFGLFLGLVWLLWTRQLAGPLLASAVLGVGLPYFFTHVESRYQLPVLGLSALVNCSLAAAIARRLFSRFRPGATVSAAAVQPRGVAVREGAAETQDGAPVMAA